MSALAKTMPEKTRKRAESTGAVYAVTEQRHGQVERAAQHQEAGPAL